jgi:hypothetical protein
MDLRMRSGSLFRPLGSCRPLHIVVATPESAEVAYVGRLASALLSREPYPGQEALQFSIGSEVASDLALTSVLSAFVAAAPDQVSLILFPPPFLGVHRYGDPALTLPRRLFARCREAPCGRTLRRFSFAPQQHSKLPFRHALQP